MVSASIDGVQTARLSSCGTVKIRLVCNFGGKWTTLKDLRHMQGGLNHRYSKIQNFGDTWCIISIQQLWETDSAQADHSTRSEYKGLV
jgi:hypothetical protein